MAKSTFPMILAELAAITTEETLREMKRKKFTNTCNCNLQVDFDSFDWSLVMKMKFFPHNIFAFANYALPVHSKVMPPY